MTIRSHQQPTPSQGVSLPFGGDVGPPADSEGRNRRVEAHQAVSVAVQVVAALVAVGLAGGTPAGAVAFLAAAVGARYAEAEADVRRTHTDLARVTARLAGG